MDFHNPHNPLTPPFLRGNSYGISEFLPIQFEKEPNFFSNPPLPPFKKVGL